MLLLLAVCEVQHVSLRGMVNHSLLHTLSQQRGTCGDHLGSENKMRYDSDVLGVVYKERRAAGWEEAFKQFCLFDSTLLLQAQLYSAISNSFQKSPIFERRW